MYSPRNKDEKSGISSSINCSTRLELLVLNPLFLLLSEESQSFTHKFHNLEQNNLE
jgi:hypothetical protein